MSLNAQKSFPAARANRAAFFSRCRRLRFAAQHAIKRCRWHQQASSDSDDRNLAVTRRLIGLVSADPQSLRGGNNRGRLASTRFRGRLIYDLTLG